MSYEPTGFGGRSGFADSNPPDKVDSEEDEDEENEYESSNDSDDDKGVESKLPPSDLAGGRIPEREPRTYKRVTKELVDGNYVILVDVPSQVSKHNATSFKGEDEFEKVRYSATTCDPNDFESSLFTLRQPMYEVPRETKLFIVVTMYNEEAELFYRSLRGIFQNLAYLTSLKDEEWGQDSWKKVVVCIVGDGRMTADQGTLASIAALGAFQDALPLIEIEDKDVTAHIFEYTTQVPISVIAPPSEVDDENIENVPPVQLLFCLKEKNQKKINSHRWFFNAFGPILKPDVCVLLDVGTMPGPTSIYHLWKAFAVNPNVGGACGEIVAMKGKYGVNLLNPLVAAQNFEYKMSNILDKPLESVMGYITVLPGAFSAYRYQALLNDDYGEGPLQKYFMGDLKPNQKTDIFTANMYLAEDRVLCWELVSKRKSQWILHYAKSAYAETDVPDKLPEFISQRRRWLNGSFFAAVHSILHFKYIYRSNHTFERKFWIHIEMAYQLYNLIFSWFALGNYYIAFVILSTSLEFISESVRYINVALNYLYIGLLVTSFILALGNRPQGSTWAYKQVFIGFAILMVYMTLASFIVAVKGLGGVKGSLIIGLFTSSVVREIMISLFSTLGLYFSSSAIALEPWHMVTSFIQYLLFSPSYVSVLNVYAFANIHDISWGTKAAVEAKDGDRTAKRVEGSGGRSVDVALPTTKKEINRGYRDVTHVLEKVKKGESLKELTPKTQLNVQQTEDLFKSIRTYVLLAWIVSNALLATIICSGIPTPESTLQKYQKLEANGTLFFNPESTLQKHHEQGNGFYFNFILYSIAVLALIRFVGSSTYVFAWMFGKSAMDFLASIRT